MMLSRKLLINSTTHSTKFCSPLGISFGARIAVCTKMMTTTVTIAVSIIELLIGKPKIENRSTGFGEVLLPRQIGTVRESFQVKKSKLGGDIIAGK